MINFERDINAVKLGQVQNLIYATLVGLKPDLSGTIQNPHILSKENGGAVNSDESDMDMLKGSCSDDTPDEENGDHDTQSKFVDSARPRHETTEEKKARKKLVKDAHAEKRKVKVKKHVKKKQEKQIKKKC